MRHWIVRLKIEAQDDISRDTVRDIFNDLKSASDIITSGVHIDEVNIFDPERGDANRDR